MRDARDIGRERGIRGFTLIELLVVIGIMAVAAAAAVPSVAAYMRGYAIRGAAQNVKAQVQTARTKAIMKNVNQGVAFVMYLDPLGRQVYQYVIEDDIVGPPYDPTPRTIDDLMSDPDPNPQLGLDVLLPVNIQFVDPGNGGTLDIGLRFNRFGRMADPGSGQPDAGTDLVLETGVPLISHTLGLGPAFPDGAWMTIVDGSTGLERTIHVAPGGRTRICGLRDCSV